MYKRRTKHLGVRVSGKVWIIWKVAQDKSIIGLERKYIYSLGIGFI